MIYLDTSAALKLVVPEPETAALELWIAERAGIPRVSSRLLRIEMVRAVTRNAPHRISRVSDVLSAIALLSIDDVAPTAEIIGDRLLRSLDAIHLATAHEIRTDLIAFICYDKRLCESAQTLGLHVETPSLFPVRSPAGGGHRTGTSAVPPVPAVTPASDRSPVIVVDSGFLVVFGRYDPHDQP
jgi:predicted nucleic acid-binding protein